MEYQDYNANIMTEALSYSCEHDCLHRHISAQGTRQKVPFLLSAGINICKTSMLICLIIGKHP